MITNRLKRWKTGMYFFMASFAWWVVFYPDLCLVKDVCSVVECDREHQYVQDEALGIDAIDFLNADAKDICVKSKLIEWIKLNEKRHKNSDSNNTNSK